jgi:hypothetical protein
MSQSKNSFEVTLNQAIDEVFTSLGENVKQATYNYIENKYKIKKEQIPSNIEDFASAVETIYGDAARLVELKIMEKLEGKTQGFIYKSDCKEIFFVEYLAALRLWMSKRLDQC